MSVTVDIQPAYERRERFRQWFPRNLGKSGPQSRGKRLKGGGLVDLGGVETAHRRQPERGQVVQAGRDLFCTGERVDGRRDGAAYHPGQKNWNFMKLTGARQTVVSGASPCGNGRPAAKRSATESPRCEGALVSRAAFDFNLRWVKSADREAA